MITLKRVGGLNLKAAFGNMAKTPTPDGPAESEKKLEGGGGGWKNLNRRPSDKQPARRASTLERMKLRLKRTFTSELDDEHPNLIKQFEKQRKMPTYGDAAVSLRRQTQGSKISGKTGVKVDGLADRNEHQSTPFMCETFL